MMNIIDTVLAAGFIGTKIAVPLLRFISSLLLAFAISKDCKARRNGSNKLWGVLTFISPVIFGIIYFVYSRFYSKRMPELESEKKDSAQSKVLCVFSVFTYLIMVAVLIISIILSVSSGVAGMIYY